MKPGATVAWMTAEQAAIYLGYQHPDGTASMNAFYTWKHRARPKAYRLRGRLRFRQADLDRHVIPESRRRVDR
jgi:hypothetical protein